MLVFSCTVGFRVRASQYFSRFRLRVLECLGLYSFEQALRRFPDLHPFLLFHRPRWVKQRKLRKRDFAKVAVSYATPVERNGRVVADGWTGFEIFLATVDTTAKKLPTSYYGPRMPNRGAEFPQAAKYSTGVSLGDFLRSLRASEIARVSGIVILVRDDPDSKVPPEMTILKFERSTLDAWLEANRRKIDAAP